MDFIKKHYEKVILSLVLLGVIAVLGVLPFLIQQDKEATTAVITNITTSKKPLDPLDLSRQNRALERVKSPFELDFETTNKIVNPVLWKKNLASGELFKIMTGHEADAEAVVVTNITPLYFSLTLTDVKTNTGMVYSIMVEHQAAARGRQRSPHMASKGEKNANFTITGVKGDPASPDELELKLTDTGETVVVAPGKPFRRPEAYLADLKFPPEKTVKTGVRVGARLTFGSDDYIVVAISENEVILSAQSNQKKTILHYQR